MLSFLAAPPDLYQAIVLIGGAATFVVLTMLTWKEDGLFVLCAIISILQYLAYRRFLHDSYILDCVCCPCKVICKICNM